MIISIVLFVLTAWMHSHKWEKVLSLSLILVIYPQVSQKYALIYFLPPLILFLNEEEKKKEDFICLFSFILISFFSWNSHYFDYYKFGTIILYLYILVKTILGMKGINKFFLRFRNENNSEE